MTLAPSTRSAIYQPASETTDYVVPFPIFSTEDLTVFVDGVEVGFSVSASFANGRAEGAIVTLLEGVSDVQVEVRGTRTPARTNDYLSTSPNLARNLQADVDVLTAVAQEIRRDTDGAIEDAAEAVAAVEGVADYRDEAQAAAASAAASAAAAEAAENTILKPKGAWLTATAYVVGDVVQESGNAYDCIVAHTSGTFATDLAAVKWRLFVSKGASGAGSGDMLNADNLSGLASKATSRANLQVPGKFGATNSADHEAAFLTRESSMFPVGTGPTNGPTGLAQHDALVHSRVDDDNQTDLFLMQAGLALRARRGGTWDDPIYYPSLDDLTAATKPTLVSTVTWSGFGFADQTGLEDAKAVAVVGVGVTASAAVGRYLRVGRASDGAILSTSIYSHTTGSAANMLRLTNDGTGAKSFAIVIQSFKYSPPVKLISGVSSDADKADLPVFITTTEALDRIRILVPSGTFAGTFHFFVWT